MRIGINLIPFSSVQGIEVFTKNLISNLLKLEPKEEILILGTKDTPQIFDFPQTRLIKIELPQWKYVRALYQQTAIYFLIKKHKIDLLFSPSPAAPLFLKDKVVVIHDCAYDRFSEFNSLLSKLYFRAMFWGAKHFSQKIITVSDFSKKELVNLYHIEPDKIKVIYEGVPQFPKIKREDISKVKKKFKIKKPYFIYVGNTRPRKNIPGLLKGFKQFLSQNPEFLLVLVGKIDNRFLNVAQKIETLNLEGKVIQTGFISDKEKVALYQKAVGLTFPSFYEGFGLPILEAQSLGVPVLASNIPSLREVARDSVLYVNPRQIKSIYRGMKKIAFNERLRKNLIEKGYKNIERFSWRESAQELLDIFHNL